MPDEKMANEKMPIAVERLHQAFPAMSALGVVEYHKTSMKKIALGVVIALVLGASLIYYNFYYGGYAFITNMFFSVGIVSSAAFSLGLLFRYFSIFWHRSPMKLSFHQEERNEEAVPIYTILVPLFKEANVLPQLIEALEEINYPRAKLDIKIILEQADNETRRAVERLTLQEGFEVIVVPDAPPRTKGKACNYALQTARGELCVIYDAEDKPDPDQLYRALHIFNSHDEKLACVQTPLIFYNWDQNWLTKQFTIEYLLQFSYFLPLITRLNLPAFLGGSSNHFRMKPLKEVLAWDPYNVTEDADIGLRFHRFGYKIEVLSSITEEEAVFSLKNWMGQRTRWVKGWLQTWLVAMRSRKELKAQIGIRGYWFLHFLVPFYLFSVLLHLFFWMGIGVVFLYEPSYAFYPALIIFINYGIAIGLSFHSLRVFPQYKKKKLIASCWSLPLYWFLLGFASLRAIFQLFNDPYYWEKTPHFVFPQKGNNNKGGEGLSA